MHHNTRCEFRFFFFSSRLVLTVNRVVSLASVIASIGPIFSLFIAHNSNAQPLFASEAARDHKIEDFFSSLLIGDADEEKAIKTLKSIVDKHENTRYGILAVDWILAECSYDEAYAYAYQLVERETAVSLAAGGWLLRRGKNVEERLNVLKILICNPRFSTWIDDTKNLSSLSFTLYEAGYLHESLLVIGCTRRPDLAASIPIWILPKLEHDDMAKHKRIQQESSFIGLDGIALGAGNSREELFGETARRILTLEFDTNSSTISADQDYMAERIFQGASVLWTDAEMQDADIAFLLGLALLSERLELMVALDATLVSLISFLSDHQIDSFATSILKYKDVITERPFLVRLLLDRAQSSSSFSFKAKCAEVAVITHNHADALSLAAIIISNAPKDGAFLDFLEWLPKLTQSSAYPETMTQLLDLLEASKSN